MRKKYMHNSFLKKSLIYLFLTVFSGISFYPLIYLIFYSFKSNNEIFYSNQFGFPRIWQIGNYVRAFKAFDMPLYYKNSIIVTSITLIVTIFLALMFSYSTARMKWKFSNTIRIYLAIGMFIPAQIVLIPIMIMERNLHLQNSYLSVILPYVGFQLSFATMVFYGFMRSIPFELEESASIDGANIYITYFKIILPIVKPAIASVVIFVFLSVWNEFLIALVLISKSTLRTIPLGLMSFSGQYSTDWGARGAAMVIATLPVIITYFFFSEQIERALTVGSAVKG